MEQCVLKYCAKGRTASDTQQIDKVDYSGGVGCYLESILTSDYHGKLFSVVSSCFQQQKKARINPIS